MEQLFVKNFDREEWKDFYFFPSRNENGVFGDRFDINASDTPKLAELITLEGFEASYGTVCFISLFPFQQLIIYTKNLVVMIRNGSNLGAPDRVVFYPRGTGDLLEQTIENTAEMNLCILKAKVSTPENYNISVLSRFFSELNIIIARNQLGRIDVTIDPDDVLPYSEDDSESATTEPKTILQVSMGWDCIPKVILNFREDGSAFTQFSDAEEFSSNDTYEPWWSMMENVATFWKHVWLDAQGKEWRKPFKIRQMI